MTVGRQDLDDALDALRASVDDPNRGLYGPGSMAWRINRETIVFLAGGRAALLQLAHPAVATAIDDHSKTRSDPLGRFRRTFRHVYTMTFGDLDEACRAARRVHAIHRRIVGTLPDGSPYQANTEEALFWVQATLIESALMAYELVVEPLSPGEREAYYAESRRFGALFGIPDRVVPPTHADFVRYCDTTAGALVPTAAARDMARFLLRPPQASLGPVSSWYRAMTAGLLPPPLRAAFGLSWGRAQSLTFDATLATLRRSYRRLPPSIRYAPAFHDARDRLEGRAPSRDPLLRATRALLAS